MVNFFRSLFILLLLISPCAQAQNQLVGAQLASVKIGAGKLKTTSSSTPTPQQKIEAENNAAMEKAVQEKKDLMPLAQNVAHMFRGDVVTLRDSLIKRTLNRLPPKKRAAQRETFARYIDIDQILSVYTQTLMTYFNKQELKALRTFMADDTGRAVLEKLPAVLSQMRLNQQQYLQNTLQDVLQKEVLDNVKDGKPSLLAP